MKKTFILILFLILCTGCVKLNKEDNNDLVINDVVNTRVIPNTTALGYKYYLPFGVNKTYDKDYNQKFKYNDYSIYLYVDIVSYFYKNPLNFNEENDINSYYYRKINSSSKTGYIKVTKEDNDLYFIKIVYNYAKIEVYVKEKDLADTMANSMIIINSIDYNDNLIKTILEDNYSLGTEKEYKIDKPEDTTSKFIEYLSEYVQNEEANISDLPEY